MGKSKPGTSARQIIAPEEPIEEDETVEESQKPKEVKSKRGAKPLTEKKPKGAARVLIDSPVLTNRPVNVYKERVTDADSGETGYYIWWTTESSKTIGREEITKINPKTEREVTIGYDFTIPYSDEQVKKLLKEAFSKTKFYNKDGTGRTHVPNPADNF